MFKSNIKLWELVYISSTNIFQPLFSLLFMFFRYGESAMNK